MVKKLKVWDLERYQVKLNHKTKRIKTKTILAHRFSAAIYLGRAPQIHQLAQYKKIKNSAICHQKKIKYLWTLIQGLLLWFLMSLEVMRKMNQGRPVKEAITHHIRKKLRSIKMYWLRINNLWILIPWIYLLTQTMMTLQKAIIQWIKIRLFQMILKHCSHRIFGPWKIMQIFNALD